MLRKIVTLSVLACLALAAAPAFAADEPDKVVVQHILIGFKKSVPGKPLERTKREAHELADELLVRAEAGEDFGELVKEYTNDSYPGLMTLTNNGAPRISGGTIRTGVVPKFGDTAFRLEVGEIGLAKYHAAGSPYGWHIIKRIE
jgi:hypothetical protein